MLMVSMSETGSIFHETWTTFGSSKQRTTCATASVSRMLARTGCQAFALDAARDESGDVDELDDRGQPSLRLRQRRDLVEPWMGTSTMPVWARWCRRIVLAEMPALVTRVEQRRFADVRQTDDPALKAHAFWYGACASPACKSCAAINGQTASALPMASSIALRSSARGA